MSGSATIELISPNANLMVLVEPAEETVDAAGNKRVTKKGERVRFVNGHARVTEDQFATIQTLPAYTGEGGRRRIYLAAEAMAPGASGPRVVYGSLGAGGSGTEQAPTDDWDTTPSAKLIEKLRKKELSGDYEAMLVYEQGHRRRLGVLRELAALAYSPPPKAPRSAVAEAEKPEDKAPKTEPGGPPVITVPDGTEGL